MKSYTITRIAKELNISHDQARTVRAIVRGDLDRTAIYAVAPKTEHWAEVECYNRPRLYEVRMAALNEVIGGYGVEGIEKPDSHGCGRYEDFIDYINTGDTYSATILYDGGRYWIGCWGDVVERLAV